MPGFSGGYAGSNYGSGYSSGGSFGRSGSSGFGKPVSTWTSPGGRTAARSIEVKPQGRHVDLDAFDDIPPDDLGVSDYVDDDAVVVRPGQKVSHKKFGAGRVERVESGTPPTVVVRFAGYGPKRIVATFLQFD
jgi:hypothetical protein